MRREKIRQSTSLVRSVPLFSLLVPLGFAVIMWWVSSSPAMMLFALMGPVAMVASMADGWRQNRAAQRAATEDAEKARSEIERQRSAESESEAERARRRHPSLADLLHHGFSRPIAGGGLPNTASPGRCRIGLDPERRPVLIPMDARLCIVGDPEDSRRVARGITLTRTWMGAGVDIGAVLNVTARAAIPPDVSLVLTLGEHGWAELTDVQAPLEAVAVLIDEMSEAQVARARQILESTRRVRFRPPTLGELRDTLTREPEDPARSGIAGILGWRDPELDSLAGLRPVCLEIGGEVPHVLVAGATGSGKTETLVALLATMAAAYSPEDFRFAIIDFKGGGGFTRVAPLAHNAGITTDLDGDDVLRALAGIRTEMELREGTLRGAGCTDVSALPASLHLARLLIVIDEFRALCDAVPDARRIVADVAARGRALGMHLAVATQRAAGAFGDDLLVNAQTRLCLTPVADDDARYLLGQSAPPSNNVEERTRLLLVRRASGHVESVHPVRVDAVTLDEARRWNARSPDDEWRLWWPALPRTLSQKQLNAFFAANGETERGCIIGLRQDTRTTRWSVFTFVPERDGSLWVVGAPRSGKTTLLRIIAHRATHAQVVIVPPEPAFAWDALVALAHACDVRAEQETVVVIADGIDAILRSTPEDALDDLVSALERIAREGPRRGLFLVLSSSGDEPLLSTVIRHMGLRIDLGNRYPGRGTVGRDEIQVTQLPEFAGTGTGRLSPREQHALASLPEVLRGRRAVVFTQTPELWESNRHVGDYRSSSDARAPAYVDLDILTPDQALSLTDEMRRRLRTEPVVWHGVARIAARYIGRDARRIPPPHPDSVVVLEDDDTYVRASLSVSPSV